MKKIKNITLSIFAVIGFVALLSSFTNQPQEESDVVLLALQGEKFGVNFIVNNGDMDRAKDEERDLLIEKYLNQGYKLHSVTHRGGLGVLYTLVK